MNTSLAAEDDRLLLALLEQVARLQSPKAKDEFRVEGYSDDQVARYLLISRDTGMINCIKRATVWTPTTFS